MEGQAPLYFGSNFTVVAVEIENDTTNDQIDAFTISNIYSLSQPAMFYSAGFWSYDFFQSDTNSCFWNLYASDSFPEMYISSSKTQEVMFAVDYPPGVEMLTGLLGTSAGFVNAGTVQSNPSMFVGPVGWRSGPFVVSLQTGQTNGTMQALWFGADGNVFVESKSNLSETSWKPFAGPFSGGRATFPISTNAMFFRLRLSK